MQSSTKKTKNFIQELSHNKLYLGTSIDNFKKLSTKQKVLTIAFLASAVLVINYMANHTSANEELDKAIDRKVSVASVSSLSNIEQDFPLIGTVTSVNQATIRSESSGKLTRVYKKLGDTVFAGGVIAEFENSGEQASVLQAEGAYEQAKASRSIAGLNNGQAGSSLGDVKTQVLNAISSTYTSMDDAVHGKTDAAYADAKFEQVRLLLSISDSNLATSLEGRRKVIEKLLVAREARNKGLTEGSDLLGELNTLQTETQMIKTYLDDVYTAYSKALPDSTFSQVALDAGKANTQVARQAIAGALGSIVSSRTSLNSSVTANQISGGSNTGSNGAIATADAAVKQAQGAYDAAMSRLSKTVIRSPITGTLNSLTINTGDYIGAFTQVAVVSNNGSLEVISFVTEDDARRVIVGAPVVIEGSIAGVVTRVASAIDPTTKKIEVRIGIKDAKANLINGQSVSITITKNKKVVTSTRTTPIVIPLSALKLTPRGANVFTVNASSSLVAIPVKEGAIIGEQIQILEGLTGKEDIVTDARGLKEGMFVEVDTQ